MALSVRLKRFGRKNFAQYRVVVAENYRKRDGVVIEELGYYDPHKEESEKISLKKDRLEHWIRQGGQPTQKLKTLLKKSKILI